MPFRNIGSGRAKLRVVLDQAKQKEKTVDKMREFSLSTAS